MPASPRNSQIRTGRARVIAGLGALVLVATISSLVSARLTPFAVFAIGLVLGADAIRSRNAGALVSWDSAPVRWLGALLLFALSSTLWSEVQWTGVPKVLLAAAISVCAFVSIRSVVAATGPDLAPAARGLAFGVLIGSIFLAVEALSGQAIQIAVYNLLHLPPELMQPARHFIWQDGRLTAMEPAHINRNFAVAALLLFPAVMAALGLFAPAKGRMLSLLLVGMVALATFASRHESSKVAILAGLAALGLAALSRVWARRVLSAGWVLACVAAVPVALAAHRLDLHNSSRLQNSMQHRIVIWNMTAEKVLEHPFFGIGAYMTYVLGPKMSKEAVTAPDERHHRTLSRHAHNVFLQTWLELGAIGALLLAGSGVSILSAIGGMANRTQPFALATFASAATMMAASYGIWQAWYLALFGLTAIALGIGALVYGPPLGRENDGAAE